MSERVYLTYGKQIHTSTTPYTVTDNQDLQLSHPVDRIFLMTSDEKFLFAIGAGGVGGGAVLKRNDGNIYEKIGVLDEIVSNLPTMLSWYAIDSMTSLDGKTIYIAARDLDWNVFLMSVKYDEVLETFTFIDKHNGWNALGYISPVDDYKFDISPDGTRIVSYFSSGSEYNVRVVWVNNGVFEAGYDDLYIDNPTFDHTSVGYNIIWPDSETSGDVNGDTFYLFMGSSWAYAITLDKDRLNLSYKVSEAKYLPITISGSEYRTLGIYTKIVSTDTHSLCAQGYIEEVTGGAKKTCLVSTPIIRGPVTFNGEQKFGSKVVVSDPSYDGMLFAGSKKSSSNMSGKPWEFIYYSQGNVIKNSLSTNGEWITDVEYIGPNVVSNYLIVTGDAIRPTPAPPTSSRRRTWSNWMQPRFIQT